MVFIDVYAVGNYGGTELKVEGFHQIERRKTDQVIVGRGKNKVVIGGGSPVSVQSMTNTDTKDEDSTLSQIDSLVKAGCDIIRLAVPDMEAASAFGRIRSKVDVPLVADIHFDYKIAIAAIENGADKIRINPGNIGGKEKIKEVVRKAKEYSIPVRVGINAGSLEKSIYEKYGGICAKGLAESALNNVKLLEEEDFNNIVVSLKASSVLLTIEAYRDISRLCSYPLHIGVTEAGTLKKGIIRSSVGIGSLLSEGIGDTLRVSLTGNPVSEVETGIGILESLGLRKQYLNLISCPTCGRTKIELEKIAQYVENELQKAIMVNKPVKAISVAIMGCAVNGPGEAREADIGIAGGTNEALLFRKGKAAGKLEASEAAKILVDEAIKLMYEI